MSDLFRQFIETNLLNLNQIKPQHYEQITPQKLSQKLHKIILKNIIHNSNDGITISPIGANIQNKIHIHQKEQNIQKNQLYMSSLVEVSTFILKLGYSHPGVILYPKYNIDNIIGFYQISKQILHSESILQSTQLRNQFNQQVIALLFTQKILVYKDIYYRIEESSVFKNFIQEFFILIGKRVQMMMDMFGLRLCKKLVETCKSHVRSFIQRYQMTESLRHLSRHHKMLSSFNMNQQNDNVITMNQSMFLSHTITNESQKESQQLLNIISIDEVIICFIYLLYRSSRENCKVAMWKLTESYFKGILRWDRYKKDNRIVELYNNCYLKLYLSGKLDKIEKSHVVFNQTKSKLFLAEIVQNQQTVLDYFTSSLQN